MLKSNNNFTIKPTDKNLGPAIMDTNRMENLKQNLKSLLQTHQAILTKQEKLYFNRSLETPHGLPVFYGLPKVHKNL